ncbi:hypothetical protein PFISCL1PPCAC_9934, partial [Pristionchus fissidentatus]
LLIASFVAFSAVYAVYNTDVTAWRIGAGDIWIVFRTGQSIQSTEDLIAAILVYLLVIAVCLMLSSIHYKTSDALVAIGRYNGSKKPILPVTRGGVSESIHGERTVTKTVTESTT